MKMKIGHAVITPTAIVLLLASTGCSSRVLATSSKRPAAASGRQQPTGDQVTVPLSDPSRPALVQISLVQGGITVRGTNRRDVLVVARSDAERARARGNP